MARSVSRACSSRAAASRSALRSSSRPAASAARIASRSRRPASSAARVAAATAVARRALALVGLLQRSGGGRELRLGGPRLAGRLRRPSAVASSRSRRSASTTVPVLPARNARPRSASMPRPSRVTAMPRVTSASSAASSTRLMPSSSPAGAPGASGTRLGQRPAALGRRAAAEAVEAEQRGAGQAGVVEQRHRVGGGRRHGLARPPREAPRRGRRGHRAAARDRAPAARPARAGGGRRAPARRRGRAPGRPPRPGQRRPARRRRRRRGSSRALAPSRGGRRPRCGRQRPRSARPGAQPWPPRQRPRPRPGRRRDPRARRPARPPPPPARRRGRRRPAPAPTPRARRARRGCTAVDLGQLAPRRERRVEGVGHLAHQRGQRHLALVVPGRRQRGGVHLRLGRGARLLGPRRGRLGVEPLGPRQQPAAVVGQRAEPLGQRLTPGGEAIEPAGEAPVPLRCALLLADQATQLALDRLALGGGGGDRRVEPRALARRPARGRPAIRARSRRAAAICDDVELDPGGVDLAGQRRGALGGRGLQGERPQPRLQLAPRGRGPAPGWPRPAPACCVARCRRRLYLPRPGRLLDEARAGRPGATAGSRRRGPGETIACSSRPRPASASASCTSSRRTASRFSRYWASASRRSRRMTEISGRPVPKRAVLVVEHQLDLAQAGRLAPRRAAEQHVGRHLRAAARSAAGWPSPTAGLGDVRLARSRWGRRSTAMPGSKRSSTGSAKLLKPRSAASSGTSGATAFGLRRGAGARAAPPPARSPSCERPAPRADLDAADDGDRLEVLRVGRAGVAHDHVLYGPALTLQGLLELRLRVEAALLRPREALARTSVTTASRTASQPCAR